MTSGMNIASRNPASGFRIFACAMDSQLIAPRRVAWSGLDSQLGVVVAHHQRLSTLQGVI